MSTVDSSSDSTGDSPSSFEQQPAACPISPVTNHRHHRQHFNKRNETRKDPKPPHLNSIHIRVRDHPVLTPHPILPINHKRQVLHHNTIHIDHLHARPLQRTYEYLQLLVPVQVCPMQQPPRPRKDRRDRIRRRLPNLLVLAVVSRDRAVRRFALDREAVGCDEL